MVRIDERNWVKTGVEYYEGRARLSTVITFDYSSWTVANLPPATSELALLLTREGDALKIHYSADGGDKDLAALVYLPPDRPVMVGAMLASPEGDGFEVSFYDISLVAH